MMKLFIGVETFQGLISDLHPFRTEEEVQAWYKQYTGVPWGEKEGHPDWSDKFEDTTYFEVEVPPNPDQPSATPGQIKEARRYQGVDIAVDDDAVVSVIPEGEGGGVWVSAWVYVAKEGD